MLCCISVKLPFVAGIEEGPKVNQLRRVTSCNFRERKCLVPPYTQRAQDRPQDPKKYILKLRLVVNYYYQHLDSQS